MGTAPTVTSTTVLTAAERVRGLVARGLTGVVIAGLSLQAFQLAPGVAAPTVEAPRVSVQADRLVAEQEGRGLTCRTAPAVTDAVVVQFDSDASAALLRFDEALDVIRSGSGSIQRYCL